MNPLWGGLARMVFSGSENTGRTFFSYIPLFHTCNFIFFFYLLTVNLHGNEDSLRDSTAVLFVSRTDQFTRDALFVAVPFADSFDV